MGEEKEKKEESIACTMYATDSRGNPNLCCCYIIDSDGRYVDPCYRPVADLSKNRNNK